MIIEMRFKIGFRLIVNSFVLVAMNLLKSSPFFPALLGQKQATQPDLGNLMVVYEYTVHQGRTRWTHWGKIFLTLLLFYFLNIYFSQIFNNISFCFIELL